MRDDIINAVLKHKIIVIVRGVEQDKLIPLAEAMQKGGIRLLEITFSQDKRVSDEQTAANIRALKQHFGGDMYIGAGTVLTEKQVEMTKQSGGEFIISPDTAPEVIKRTKALEMVSMPGAYTPSEIRLAQKSGADFVKIFPAVNLGAEYIKAVVAPLSDIKLLAVGGINDKNMKEYLGAGVCGFGIGSSIVDKKLIENKNFKAITELAKQYTSLILEG